MSTSWLKGDGAGVTLSLFVQPGATRTEVVGLHGEALKIRLHAPPVDGQANECLLEFIAEKLDVAKNTVWLLGGAASRSKRVRVAGIKAASALELMLVKPKKKKRVEKGGAQGKAQNEA